ncbi:MAG: hypothetical protein NNA23_08440 [Nitrospira sp.]|nr:hypothetical protein [Nitrospira sp.]MCP9465619.1 hypothetical protein [Nitrospira sp.]
MSLQPLSRVAITCLLTKGSAELEADGCLYDLTAPNHTTTLPVPLRAGDYVKLRLWLPNDDSPLSVELAEVEWVENHRLKVDLLSLSPEARTRLNQFRASQRAIPPMRGMSDTATDHILIRF